jgi:integrase
VFTLAAVLREAVDDGRLTKNPAERVWVGAKTGRRVDPMHIADVSGKVPALSEVMPARWRAALLLMTTTGMRLGKCMGLTVDRVDVLWRTIRVDRQRVDGGGLGTPKKRAGVWSIPVPAAVVEFLAEHLAV